MDINLVNGLVLLILGFGIGVLSGFFGVGGSFILTPSLNILGFPMVNAVASGLAFALSSSTLAGVKHYAKGNIVMKIGIPIGIIAIMGVKLSHPLVVHLEELNLAGDYIRFVYIFLLLMLGILPLLQKNKKDSVTGSGKDSKLVQLSKNLPPVVKIGSAGQQISIWSLLALGLFVGFLKGFMGVGGGFVLVPLLILVLGMDTRKAVGTSLVVILISGIYATYLYFVDGKVLLSAVIILSVGASVGVRFGTTAINNISDMQLQKFYSVFLLFTSVGVIMQQMNLETISLIYTFTLVAIITSIVLGKYYFGIGLSTTQDSVGLNSNQ